jgi:hypothetical protein
VAQVTWAILFWAGALGWGWAAYSTRIEGGPPLLALVFFILMVACIFAAAQVTLEALDDW